MNLTFTKPNPSDSLISLAGEGGKESYHNIFGVKGMNGQKNNFYFILFYFIVFSKEQFHLTLWMFKDQGSILPLEYWTS